MRAVRTINLQGLGASKAASSKYGASDLAEPDGNAGFIQTPNNATLIVMFTLNMIRDLENSVTRHRYCTVCSAEQQASQPLQKAERSVCEWIDYPQGALLVLERDYIVPIPNVTTNRDFK